jgi:hypothetical protein
MKTCSELGIEPCPYCANKMVDTGCWMVQWGFAFHFELSKNQNPKYNFQIDQFERLSKYNDKTYLFYWFAALKQFKPELAEKFEKLMILI